MNNPWVLLPNLDFDKLIISSSSFTDGHESRDTKAISYIEKTKQLLHTNDEHNGGMLTIFLDSNNALNILQNDYATVTAARDKNRPKDILIRPHYNCGVILLCKTTDNNLVLALNNFNGKNIACFPAGFIEPSTAYPCDKLLNLLKKSPNELEKLIFYNAMKEGNEEVIIDFDSHVCSKRFLGAISKKLTWEQMDAPFKEIISIKSFVLLIDLDISFKELINKRNSHPPIDSNELAELVAIDIDQIKKITEFSTNSDNITLDNTKLPFLVEHGKALQLYSSKK